MRNAQIIFLGRRENKIALEKSRMIVKEIIYEDAD
jgi:hypothetical protein